MYSYLFENFFRSGPNGRNGHGITELLVGGGIGDGYEKLVGKPLEPCPFPGRHLADAFFVDLSLDVGGGIEIGDPFVDDQVSFPAHSTANNGVGDPIVGDDLEAETVAFAFMP